MASGERVYEGTRMRKLGIRPGMTAYVHHVPEAGFAAELAEHGVDVVTAVRGPVDVVFLGVATEADLALIRKFKSAITKQGTLWLIRPKGAGTPVSERAAMAAGLDAGLVDVKVVSFSDTHSALKYVYRLRDR
ncbi:MAG: hypothetical protein ABR598_06960 [Candidatus Dormibacteria bacterium]